jgi:hypothetical protein
MYRLGQHLHLNDGSLIQICRAINANTFEFTVLKSGKQLLDEILSKTKASYFGPLPAAPPANDCSSLREKTAAWISTVLEHNDRPHAHDIRR